MLHNISPRLLKIYQLGPEEVSFICAGMDQRDRITHTIRQVVGVIYIRYGASKLMQCMHLLVEFREFGSSNQQPRLSGAHGAVLVNHHRSQARASPLILLNPHKESP